LTSYSPQKRLGPFLLGIVDDLGGSAFFDKGAAIHEEYPVSYLPGKGHFMGYNHHGHLFRGKIPDNLEDFPGKFRV
jgi:hypothetical protein